MRRQVGVHALHLLKIRVGIGAIQRQVHRRKVQLKRRGVDKGIAEGSQHDAHLDALGGRAAIEPDEALHQASLLFPAHPALGYDDQVDVAGNGVEAAHRQRAVQIDAGQSVRQYLPAQTNEGIGQVRIVHGLTSFPSARMPRQPSRHAVAAVAVDDACGHPFERVRGVLYRVARVRGTEEGYVVHGIPKDDGPVAVQ